MDSKTIFEKLQSKFGEEAIYDLHEPEIPTQDTWFFVKPQFIQQVAKHLRDNADLACNYMECLTGVDYPDEPAIHVVYHAFSYRHRHRVIMKVSLPREDPRVETVSSVWSAAIWQERECYDLLGVHFDKHPDLRRIMMPDDWEGHPLRKDYENPAAYHGISTTRQNPIDLLAKPKPVKKAKPAAKKAKPAAKKASAPQVDKTDETSGKPKEAKKTSDASMPEGNTPSQSESASDEAKGKPGRENNTGDTKTAEPEKSAKAADKTDTAKEQPKDTGGKTSSNAAQHQPSDKDSAPDTPDRDEVTSPDVTKSSEAVDKADADSCKEENTTSPQEPEKSPPSDDASANKDQGSDSQDGSQVADEKRDGADSEPNKDQD